jgi:hypothetical protein
MTLISSKFKLIDSGGHLQPPEGFVVSGLDFPITQPTSCGFGVDEARGEESEEHEIDRMAAQTSADASRKTFIEHL